MKEILDLLQEGKTFSLQDLSERLNVDIQGIKAQIDYLEKHGYIKRVVLHTGCESKCCSCGVCNCGTQSSVLWELS